MSTNNVSLDAAALLQKRYRQDDTLKAGAASNAVTSPIEGAREQSEQIKAEAAEYNKQIQYDDYLRTIASRVRSGFYNQSQLESIFSSLKPMDCNTNGSVNKRQYLSQVNLVNETLGIAQEQKEKLEKFGTDERYEKVITGGNDDEITATKEQYGLAEETLKYMQDSGDNTVTFDEVLREIQSGHYDL